MRSVNGQPSNFKEPKNTVSDGISKKTATAHLLLLAVEPEQPKGYASDREALSVTLCQR